MNAMPNKRGFVIAAAASGSGKTTLTLGILRALARRGIAVAAAKSGPDFIDPGFHAQACGNASINLDAWAMPASQLRALAASLAGDFVVVEGAMGLFDAGIDGRGSTADVAVALDLPVVLILDVARQGQSAVAIAEGLARHRPEVRVAGVVLNSVGSVRHGDLLEGAFAASGLPVLGMLPRISDATMPSRHLGLIQAGEIGALDELIDKLADAVEFGLDLQALQALASPLAVSDAAPAQLPVPGRAIAIARDQSFAFIYPHLLAGWRRAGAEVSFFSPLADEPPTHGADCIYLPGGYPELHADRLAGARRFSVGMHEAHYAHVPIYGECGGYMTLGETLIDARGKAHPMLGLLPLATSFETRQRQLGYRRLRPLAGPWPQPLAAHEFHYCTTTTTGDADPLFEVTDSDGGEPYKAGLVREEVAGSFMHVIDAAPQLQDASRS